MSWLLPPAPCPSGSPSKAAQGPQLQEWGWGGGREVHWFPDCLKATLLLELSLLLSNSRLRVNCFLLDGTNLGFGICQA